VRANAAFKTKANVDLRRVTPSKGAGRDGLLKEVEKSFGQRGNSRGLFAATQFESARGGEVSFTLTGGATGAWLNGEIVRPGETFTVTARPGLNTLVLQLNSARPPALLRLAANDVAFRTE